MHTYSHVNVHSAPLKKISPKTFSPVPAVMKISFPTYNYKEHRQNWERERVGMGARVMPSPPPAPPPPPPEKNLLQSAPPPSPTLQAVKLVVLTFLTPLAVSDNLVQNMK